MKDNPKPKKIVPEPTKEDIEFDNHEIDWHFINLIDSEKEHLFEIISNNQIEIELNEVNEFELNKEIRENLSERIKFKLNNILKLSLTNKLKLN